MALGHIIEISSTDITPYIKSYTVSYEQNWIQAGRNMAGILHATYVSTTPVISLEFKALSGSEMKVIEGLVNHPSFSVKWYDNQSETIKTGTFYRNQCKPKMIRKDPLLFDEMTMNLISYGVI